MDWAAIATAVTGVMELIRTQAFRMQWFMTLEELTQSIILQLVAIALGIGAVYARTLSLAIPLIWPDILFGGFVVSTGSAGIHIIFAWLGIQGNVAARTRSSNDELDAQAAPYQKVTLALWR